MAPAKPSARMTGRARTYATDLPYGILCYWKQLQSETNVLPTVRMPSPPLELAPPPSPSRYDRTRLSDPSYGTRPAKITHVTIRHPVVIDRTISRARRASPMPDTDSLDEPRETIRLSSFLNARAPSDVTTWPCLKL
ncbi:hypothetical protein B0H14DRAFT_3521789 [Mycena olivaceomarginata]|nr:hypothetical protein B0H14DRAFT_3521789 [Mycena olivaceomarginata]